MMDKELGSKEQHFRSVNALLELAKFPDAIEIMQSWSKAWLNQFVLTYPENYALLKHEDFKPFWAERRASLNAGFTFVEQNKVADIDLVLGYIFYLMACKEKENKNEEQFLKYLSIAIKYDSIHAAQTLMHHIFMQKTMDPAKKMELLASTLYNLESLAAKHGTSGYLLLANGYLHLLELGSKQQSSELYNSSSYYLWYNLIRAERDESRSQASILNAYFGKGLGLSNSFKLTTIRDMKEKSAPFIVDETVKSRAESKAQQTLRLDSEAACKKAMTWLASRKKIRASDTDSEETYYSPGL